MDQVQAVDQRHVDQPQKAEQRIPMSYADFLDSFDDSTHAEWVNGEAIVFMPPNTRHQRIVHFLNLLVSAFLKVFRYGEIFEAPYAMSIDPNGSIREPDLLFVAKEHAHFVGEQRLNGPADLVIEVISTESVARDRGDKFYEYQSGGVREYWVIDPRPGFMRADFWILDESGRYRPIPPDADGFYHSTVLPNFRLDINLLLADTLPEPFEVVADMVGKDALLRAFNLEA